MKTVKTLAALSLLLLASCTVPVTENVQINVKLPSCLEVALTDAGFLLGSCPDAGSKAPDDAGE